MPTLSTLTRWLPLLLVLSAAVAAPTVTRFVLPPTVTSSLEFSVVMEVLASTVWIGSLALLMSILPRAFSRKTSISSVGEAVE